MGCRASCFYGVFGWSLKTPAQGAATTAFACVARVFFSCASSPLTSLPEPRPMGTLDSALAASPQTFFLSARCFLPAATVQPS